MMCIHSQEYETCSFGCTFKDAKELRLENDKLKKRIKELGAEVKTLKQSCDNHVAINRQRLDRIKELESEVAARPAKPLMGETRSRLLVAMDNSANIDDAIDKYKKLQERIEELEVKNTLQTNTLTWIVEEASSDSLIYNQSEILEQAEQALKE